MNERIRLLADHAKAYANQCTKDLDGDIAWHWMDYYTEKFAELIVVECASIVSSTAVENPPNDLFYGYNLGVNKTAEKIKQHFGVEE